MDSDLERIGRGIGVSAETAEAATSVLSRTEVTDALTTVRSGGPPTAYTPGRYYEYDEARRRRSIWPWLLAVLALALLLVGGVFAYQQLQDQFAATEAVTVPDVEGLEEELAVRNIRDAGLEPNVRRLPDSEVQRGIVVSQDPETPQRVDPGTFVTIIVSKGKPTVQVPNLVGRGRDEAVALLSDANLNANVVEVNSAQATGTVTAQSPKAGATVVEGTSVRVNVSKGPKPISVPNVVGQQYASAESALQGLGFGVGREDVESDEPAGIVVGQSPGAGSEAAKGSTVTLQVSEGPPTSTVPDVTSQDEAAARSQLRSSGFRVRVVGEDTEDPTLDGLVTSQDPPGGTELEAGEVVTIFVGRLIVPEEEDDEGSIEPPPPPDTTTTTP
jgi:serine/threonine-protein kinase